MTRHLTQISKPKSRNFLSRVLLGIAGTLCWAAVGAVMLGLVSALFGLCFAGVGKILRINAGNIAYVTAFFAGCGALAGLILGGFCRITDGCNPLGSDGANTKEGKETLRFRMHRLPEAPRNRIKAFLATPARAKETPAAETRAKSTRFDN